jgi:predicted unusual protein kinase regulating ubiquinone biosynthesis (AarF/ABC1/UbiB family)
VEYVEKFSLSQFSVPPLSGALVKKTFRKYFGKNPEDIFDEFSAESVNAASIGQVHTAKKMAKNWRKNPVSRRKRKYFERP